MAMEQELIAEEMPAEEVRSMCDPYAQVTCDVLFQIPFAKRLSPSHPIDTFRRENEALRGVITLNENGLDRIAKPVVVERSAPIVLLT